MSSNTNSIRSSAFNAMANKTSTDLSKTKLCMYFKVGCHKDNCSFAHSKEELRPTMCRFGVACRKQECWFYHPGDCLPSADDLFESATKGVKFIEPKEKKEKKEEKKEYADMAE